MIMPNLCKKCLTNFNNLGIRYNQSETWSAQLDRKIEALAKETVSISKVADLYWQWFGRANRWKPSTKCRTPYLAGSSEGSSTIWRDFVTCRSPWKAIKEIAFLDWTYSPYTRNTFSGWKWWWLSWTLSKVCSTNSSFITVC